MRDAWHPLTLPILPLDSSSGEVRDAVPKLRPTHKRGGNHHSVDDTARARSAMHFTLRTNTLTYTDLQDFIKCYHSENRHQRTQAERFKPYSYEELAQRDKANLDITWIKDESLEQLENLPPPEILAAEIIENLEDALEQFKSIQETLEKE